MGNKVSNNNQSIVVVISILGLFISRYVSSKIQLFFSIIILIILVFRFINDKKRGKMEMPSYAYFGAIPIAILFILYLLGKSYLNWDENVLQGLMALVTFPMIYIILMGFITKFKSGNKEQINMAKKGLIILAIIIILIIFVVANILMMNK